MRIVEHRQAEVHKLLHLETEGCVVNVTIGVHDQAGHRFTSIEVVPSEPDDDGAVWELRGQSTIVVRRVGQPILVREIDQ